MNDTLKIPELTVVALRHPVECKGGVLPEGGKGTVVHVYRDGEHYEVEFADPFPARSRFGAKTSVANEPTTKGRKRDPGQSEDHPISAEYRSSDRGIQSKILRVRRFLAGQLA